MHPISTFDFFVYLWHDTTHNSVCVCMYIYIYECMYLPTTSHRQDVRQGQFFKLSLRGKNSEFSFF